MRDIIPDSWLADFVMAYLGRNPAADYEEALTVAVMWWEDQAQLQTRHLRGRHHAQVSH